MARIFDDATRKNIGERFRRHHPTRKGMNAACAHGRVVNRLRIQNKWAQIVEQLQPRQLASARIRAAIVNFGHF